MIYNYIFVTLIYVYNARFDIKFDVFYVCDVAGLIFTFSMKDFVFINFFLYQLFKFEVLTFL